MSSIFAVFDCVEIQEGKGPDKEICTRSNSASGSEAYTFPANGTRWGLNEELKNDPMRCKYFLKRDYSVE